MGVISSGVLAGLAKVGLVVVSIGGLSVGAYFAYQVGPGGGSDGTSVQIEPTLAVSSPTAALATPTATVESGTPQLTPPAVDTLDWVTYQSEFGFNIEFPPDWTPLQLDSQPLIILNPKARAERDRRLDEGTVGTREFPTFQTGEAWIEIGNGPREPFDVDSLSILCLGSITETVFKGFRAAACDNKIWIEKPDGNILFIARENIGVNFSNSDALLAVQNTLVFDR